MKRKGLVASILAVFMSITMIVPVFADIQINEDKDISDWGDQFKDAKVVVNGDYTLTVDEGKEVSVRSIFAGNYGEYDLTISGGGTLNVGTSGYRSYLAIAADNVMIQGTTVNANGSMGGIAAGALSNGSTREGNVTINNATVHAEGYFGGIQANEMTVTDSTVTAKGTASDDSAGISVYGDLSINNSDVTADGGDKAISSEGDITLTNASVVEGSYDGKHVKIEKTGSSGAVAPILNPVPQSNNKSSSDSDSSTVSVSIAQMITEAAQGATVSVIVTGGTSLGKTVVDAFMARPDITLVVDYIYNGVMYRALIPAGTDLTPYLNAMGGIDFDTLTVYFGGKQIF